MTTYLPKSLFILLFPIALCAAPKGEKVVEGRAKIERSSPHHVEVRQESQKAIVEWDNFSLAGHETARFVQPSADSAILNRVVGGNLSEIYGKMEGNGHVFLVNPNGVLVGETGQINCAGFVASGFNVDSQSFLADSALRFEKGSGTVVNLGKIQARGGKVYLVGADVQNPGWAQGDQGVYIQIGDSADIVIGTSVSKLEQVVDNLFALAINHDGLIDASFVRTEEGRVFLDAESSAPAFTLVDLPYFYYDNGGKYMAESLYSLQQLGSLIPERLWYQRFAMLVNQPRFKAAVKGYAPHSLLGESEPTVGFGASTYYSLQNTVSGDPIRMSDDYLQFINSPYWKTPDELQQLKTLQTKALK